MPPGPIEGSCLPSPTAISFAPERSISSVRASMRLWSTIPASSRITVVSGADLEVPRVRTRDQRIEGQRAAVERGAVRPEPLGRGPRHGDPDHLAAGSDCSARAAASITTPFPVPAGPTSTARRSGPVTVRSACCCSTDRGAPMHSATSLLAFALAPLADVAAGRLGELVARVARSPAPGPEPPGSSSARPPR